MPAEKIYIVYDGECPLCQFGVSRVAIKQHLGELVLVDARTQKDHPVMQEIRARGLDIDQGMVVVMGDSYFHGAEAMQAIALMSTAKNGINRLGKAVFRSKQASCILYPFLKAGRLLALKAKSVPLLNEKSDKNQ